MCEKEIPKLSIAITAYNHEAFISKALESVFAQQVDFSFEVLVGDDHSTDGTAEIVRSFENRFPDRIELLTTEQNQGVFRNALRLLGSCRGEYMVIMDGDDWWTNEHKLQTQIDFLENNKDYEGCFHDAEIVRSEKENAVAEKYLQGYRYYSQFNHYTEDLYPWDLVERTIIPTCSLVFRKGNLIGELKEYESINHSLAWVCQLMIIKGQKFRYFNECWSVYNNNSGGLTKKVKTKKFIDNNIGVLTTLLTDDYYRNVKHHIYRSLAIEVTNMFFLEDGASSRKEKTGMMFHYFVYMQKHVYFRICSLLKHF